MSDQLIIFDFDGVIVNSEPIHIGVITKTLQGYGLAVDIDWVKANIHGRSPVATRDAVRDQFGFDLPDRYMTQHTRRIKLEYLVRLRAMHRAAQALANTTGWDSCIASGAPMDRIQLGLRLTRLKKYFPNDRIFPGNSVKRGKPFPDIFENAAEVMGFAPENCTVVEDSVPGVTATRRAGMKSIGVSNPLVSNTALTAAGSHLLIGGLEVLPGAIILVDSERYMPGFNDIRDAFLQNQAASMAPC